MAFTEIDSFVEKFKHLWHAGLRTSLNVEAENGQASVTLKAGLGFIPPPFQVPRPTPFSRGPSYQRRQVRREAARAAAVNNDIEQTEQVRDEQDSAEIDRDQVAEEATEIVQEVIEAEKAKENFPCLLCDFKSIWENGLAIHMSRTHSQIEQLDGNITFSEEMDNKDQKYYGTRQYWENGELSTIYQTFIDAQNIIENSDLNEEEKEKEKVKLLEARKVAFGENFRYYPPWSLKS